MTKTTITVDTKTTRRLTKLKVHGNQSYEELILCFIVQEEQRRKKMTKKVKKVGKKK